MARRPAPPPTQPTLALTVSRDEARTKIHQQIERGRALLALDIGSRPDLTKAHAERSKWTDYTKELLALLFTNRTPATDFEYGGLGAISSVPRPFALLIADFREGVQAQITRLESITDRLVLIPEPHSSVTGSQDRGFRPTERDGHSRKVFIVHGHDGATRQSVCRFLEKLDLEPIVLHEQANKGRTVMEKIEANSDVEFAVVLMTGDDVGGVENTTSDRLVPRARQNVILELGYFLGRIGRDRVCALHEQGVELPSDYVGVVFVPLDGGWQLELAREIRAAGIHVDLNLL